MATLAALVVNLKADTAQYHNSMGTATKQANLFRNTIARAGGALALMFGGRQLLRGAKSVITAFNIQQLAVESLRASLIATGKDGDASLRQLTTSAAELQRITTAGDESIIKATASLAQLAPALDTASLREAQTAIIGIAETFTKGDLENAALLIGKSVGSSTNALTRYGIEVDTAATAQEKMAQILDQSSTFFDVAKAKANTSAGVMEQLSNAWGDLKEAIGEVLEKKTSLTTFLQGVTELVGDMAVIIGGSGPQVRAMFGNIGVIAGNAFAFGILNSIATAMDKVIRALADKPMILVAQLIADADQLFDFFSKLAEEAKANIDGALIGIGDIADTIRTTLREGGPTAAEGAGSLTDDVRKELSTLEEAGASAGRSLVRGIIRGIDDMGDFLRNIVNQLAEDLIIGGLEKALDIKSPSRAAARIGRQTVAGYVVGLREAAGGVSQAIGQSFALAGAVPAAAGGGGGGGGTVIHQTLTFNLSSIDSRGMEGLLRAQKGTIASVVAEAAQDGVGFRRALRGR